MSERVTVFCLQHSELLLYAQVRKYNSTSTRQPQLTLDMELESTRFAQ